jgi:hypothetical protein
VVSTVDDAMASCIVSEKEMLEVHFYNLALVFFVGDCSAAAAAAVATAAAAALDSETMT